MIVVPVAPGAQAASWRALLELQELVKTGWTLVGGQMVHLHCAERGHFPPRPTNDVDTIVDIRADPAKLLTFTRALDELGFEAAGTSAEGIQHRWRRGDATVDVLLPEGVGERASARRGAGGRPTIATAGGTQALARSQTVAVSINQRAGFVPRPTLVGALVMKAAAHTSVADGAKGRHRLDFVTLAALIAASDFRDVDLGRKDRERLRAMLVATRADPRAMAEPDAAESIARLERVARLVSLS